MTKRPHRPVSAGAPLSEGSASGASDRCERRIVATSEQDKRLRAELAEGLGFSRESGPRDVARYREHIAERKTREEAGERDGWGLGGYKWRQWAHLKGIERRRTDIETQGTRLSVADLYEDL